MTDVLETKSHSGLEMPGFSWPSWDWMDEILPILDWRRMIRIEQVADHDTLVVRAELPGMDPEKDIDVSVHDDVLIISASKSERAEDNTRQMHRSEFRYGELTRTVTLPHGVDASKIEASYNDGVLEVRLPGAVMEETVATHQIPIKRA